MVIFCITFLALFFDIFSQFQNKSDQPIIAKATGISNDIRLKQSQQFDWTTTTNLQKIHLGDQIFSGENSQVSIEMSDGQKVHVFENSLIKFEEKKGVKNFKISFGNVKTQVKQGEMIEISICGQVQRIVAETNDELMISNNDNCVAPKIQFAKKLTAVVLNKKRRNLENVVDKFIVESQPKPIAPIALSPPILRVPLTSVWANEKSKKIEWSEVLHASGYVVLLTDKKNSTFVQKIETKDLNFEFTPDSEIDDYKYSVQAMSDQKEYFISDYSVGEIQIKYLPIKIEKPENTFVMNARTADQSAKTYDYDIQWAKTSRTDHYLIEFSDDEVFTKVSESYKSKTNSWSGQFKNFEKKYYRVKSLSASGKERTVSQSVAFVEYIKKFDLLPPVIEERSKNISLFFQKTEGQFIRLGWLNSQSDKAAKYYIEVSKDKDFKTIFKSYSVTKPYIHINESVALGEYYWRVKSFSSEIVSNWSDTGVFKISSQRSTASSEK